MNTGRGGNSLHPSVPSASAPSTALGMAAIASLASSWALESGSLERAIAVARADCEEPGSAAEDGPRAGDGALWCTLRKGEDGEDAPCHVAGGWVERRGPWARHSDTQHFAEGSGALEGQL